MIKKLLVIICVTLSFGVILVPYSEGKEYPIKPIEIVITFGPGTINDRVTRLAAEIGKKYFSQPLVVVTKLGGSGTVGASEVINSKPDGYKILYLNHNYFATTVRTQKISFDPNYLIPLVNFMELMESLGVSGDSPWKTLDQLLDYGRKNPGKIRHGHGGRGTGGHILDWLIYKKAGVEITDVSYTKGTLEIIPPLLGGHIDSGHIIYSSAKSQ